jgi:hypothetical protein
VETLHVVLAEAILHNHDAAVARVLERLSAVDLSLTDDESRGRGSARRS